MHVCHVCSLLPLYPYCNPSCCRFIRLIICSPPADSWDDILAMWRLPPRIRPSIFAFGTLADGFLPFDSNGGEEAEVRLAFRLLLLPVACVLHASVSCVLLATWRDASGEVVPRWLCVADACMPPTCWHKPAARQPKRPFPLPCSCTATHRLLPAPASPCSRSAAIVKRFGFAQPCL